MRLISDSTGENITLPLWKLQPMRRQRRGETRRGSFAPGFVVFGDLMIEPHTITITGVLGGADWARQEMQGERDRLYRFIRTGDMWIVENERRMKVSTVRDDEQVKENKLADNLSSFTITFDVLRWWESTERLQVVRQVSSGEAFFNIEYGGNREAYPWILFYVNSPDENTMLEIEVNSRRLRWEFIDAEDETVLIPGADNLLTIDCERGLVWFNGISAPFQISDHSQMLAIEPGTNNMVIRHTGSGGTLEFSYRVAFETS